MSIEGKKRICGREEYLVSYQLQHDSKKNTSRIISTRGTQHANGKNTSFHINSNIVWKRTLPAQPAHDARNNIKRYHMGTELPENRMGQPIAWLDYCSYLMYLVYI